LRRYCNKITSEEDKGLKRKTKKVKIIEKELTILKNRPMYTALLVYLSLLSLSQAPFTATLLGLWLGRIYRTASYELGYCFGINYCIYYAYAI
jgi:hypothetical protein